MGQVSNNPAGVPAPATALVTRSQRGLRARLRQAQRALRSAVQTLTRRTVAAAQPAADPRRLDDQLEQLHDLRWQISDSARQYRDLLDAQLHLIVRRDATGQITFANRAYLKTFGLSETGPVPAHHMPHVLSSDAPDGRTRRTRELIETAAGPRWIEWEDCVLSTGALPGVEMQRSGRDITDERRIAEELRTAHDAALAASRAKSRFLATMSHEIRTPMNGILGMSDLMLSTPLAPDQAAYAGAIQQSARALMRIIDEILDFSKIEAGKLVLSERPFRLADTIENCVSLLRPRALDKGLQISWSMAGGTPDILAGDEARLRQILLNLISNAVKFTDAGRVTISVEATAEGCRPGAVRLRMAVSDTGIGLSPRDQEQLFAEFEQSDAAVKRQDGGTGLGLAISLRIARAMGGTIVVQSAPGAGSTFTAEVVLATPPVSIDDAPGAPAPVSLRPAAAAGRPALRVLLAEDNDINALLATRLLERTGFAVTRARTGEDAVDLIARWLSSDGGGFDLVLMDILMPRLDGLGATRAIRQLLAAHPGSPPLPIIAVTANAYEEDRRRYLAAGMDDYLAKPFDGRDLDTLLARWLSRGAEEIPAA